MNSTVFGFGFLDVHPKDDDDDTGGHPAAATPEGAADEAIDGWASVPGSPLSPTSPTGFGFADAQLSRASDAMATPGSSHHKLFERTASQATIYGFVDLGDPPGATVGFDHFVGAFKYPTTHKLNPLLFNQGCDGEMTASDDDHDGNSAQARTGFVFGGPDDHSATNHSYDAPGYGEGHFSVCVGEGAGGTGEEALVFWGGSDVDGFC